MKHLTIKKLQENFCGKFCTILTTSVAKQNFDDAAFANFFTVMVESIDEDGVFARHFATKQIGFYSWEFIVGIVEEQIISESNPAYEKIQNELKKAPESNSDASPYVDPVFLKNLIK